MVQQFKSDRVQASREAGLEVLKGPARSLGILMVLLGTNGREGDTGAQVGKVQQELMAQIKMGEVRNKWN
jgi:hypothetical protein